MLNNPDLAFILHDLPSFLKKNKKYSQLRTKRTKNGTNQDDINSRAHKR